MSSTRLFSLVLLLSILFVHIITAAQKPKIAPGPKEIDETTRWSKCNPSNQSIYDYQVQTLEGKYEDLKQYKGQVLLVINVATFCG